MCALCIENNIHECICVWRLEMDVKCGFLAASLPHFFFNVCLFSLNLGLSGPAILAGLQAPGILSVSASSVLRCAPPHLLGIRQS